MIRYDIDFPLLVKIIDLRHDMVYKGWNIMISCIDIEKKLNIRGSISLGPILLSIRSSYCRMTPLYCSIFIRIAKFTISS